MLDQHHLLSLTMAIGLPILSLMRIFQQRHRLPLATIIIQLIAHPPLHAPAAMEVENAATDSWQIGNTIVTAAEYAVIATGKVITFVRITVSTNTWNARFVMGQATVVIVTVAGNVDIAEEKAKNNL
ncbi:MAG: hypothetical protein J6U04_10160 [Salinivirgaceae bacterium]|nr:hypothetical protein [Salinivirgaceae bacterium]